MGQFKNVQIDLKFPKGVLSEKTVIKHDTLSLSAASTPPIEQVFIFAQKHMLPHDLKIESSLTYQQVKDLSSANAGSLLRTHHNSVNVPASFFLRIVEPSKENLECKVQLQMKSGYTLSSLPEVFQNLFNY